MNSDSSLRKRRGCSPYGFEELKRFRLLLGILREDLSRSFRELSDALRRAIGESLSDFARLPEQPGDPSGDGLEEGTALSFLARAEEAAIETDDALERIDNRSFGICESCDGPIPIERLDAAPAARLCGSCQRAREETP